MEIFSVELIEMSDTHNCKYCEKEFYWHRLLNHMVKEHKAEFLSDKEHKTTLQTHYKRKEGITKVVIEKGSMNPIYCCFGCMKLFSREHYKIEHMRKSKGCKEKHIAFEEENKMMFLDDKMASQIVSDSDNLTLLNKLKLLEAENEKLKKANTTLKNQLELEKESCEEEMDKRMALQDVVDEELTPQQREIFKRILARKAPEVFKELYDEQNYEVSVSDSDEERNVEEVEEEEEEKEEPPFVPPRNILISAKPSVPRPFEYRGQWFFKDDKNILYDKTPRGDFVRAGILKNGEVVWDKE